MPGRPWMHLFAVPTTRSAPVASKSSASHPSPLIESTTRSFLPSRDRADLGDRIEEPGRRLVVHDRDRLDVAGARRALDCVQVGPRRPLARDDLVREPVCRRHRRDPLSVDAVGHDDEASRRRQDARHGHLERGGARPRHEHGREAAGRRECAARPRISRAARTFGLPMTRSPRPSAAVTRGDTSLDRGSRGHRRVRRYRSLPLVKLLHGASNRQVRFRPLTGRPGGRHDQLHRRTHAERVPRFAMKGRRRPRRRRGHRRCLRQDRRLAGEGHSDAADREASRRRRLHEPLRHSQRRWPFPSLKAAQDAGAATLNYGVFINAIINS